MGFFDWINRLANLTSRMAADAAAAVSGSETPANETPTCRMIKGIFPMPNRCVGNCPPGQECFVAEEVPYLVVFKQPKRCVCIMSVSLNPIVPPGPN